jgi:hypothetical protein
MTETLGKLKPDSTTVCVNLKAEVARIHNWVAAAKWSQSGGEAHRKAMIELIELLAKKPEALDIFEKLSKGS